MSYMFSYAISFNGDLSGWDVSNVSVEGGRRGSGLAGRGVVSGQKGIEYTFLYHITLSKQDSPKTPNDIQ